MHLKIKSVKIEKRYCFIEKEYYICTQLATKNKIMSLKMISYREISNNDKVVLFELDIEETTDYLFKSTKKQYLRKGYWTKKDYLMFYSDDGSIMHGLYESVRSVIDSGIKEYKF